MLVRRGSVRYSEIRSTWMQPMVRTARARIKGFWSAASYKSIETALDIHEWRTARPEEPDRAAHRRSWWDTGSKAFSSRYLPAAYSWWHRWKDPRRSSRQSSKQWPSSKRPFSHRRCWRQAAASAHLLLLQIRQPGRNRTLFVISKEFAGSLSDLLDNIHDLYIEDLLIQE